MQLCTIHHARDGRAEMRPLSMERGSHSAPVAHPRIVIPSTAGESASYETAVVADTMVTHAPDYRRELTMVNVAVGSGCEERTGLQESIAGGGWRASGICQTD